MHICISHVLFIEHLNISVRRFYGSSYLYKLLCITLMLTFSLREIVYLPITASFPGTPNSQSLLGD